MANLKIGSVNCRGLFSDHIKRRDIFSKCRDKYDITFLIDTHSTAAVETYWQSEWGYVAKFSSFSSCSRGVGILFKNTFKYTLFNEIYDTLGNYVILDVSIFDQRLTLVALYGPNNDNPTFFKDLFKRIRDLGNSSVIIGGDWNVPLDYDKDTRNYLHKNNKNANEMIHTLIAENDLIDVWREINPDDGKFTWRGPNKKQARLDYLLISSDLQVFTKNAGIDIAYKSDHSPVTVDLSFIDQERGRSYWKFNNSLLSNPEYVNIVKTCITNTLDQYRISGDENNSKYSINDQLLWETLKLMIRGSTISFSSYNKKDRDKREKGLENKLEQLYQTQDLSTVDSEIKETELALETIRNEKIQGMILRTKAKWKVEGEKSTQYFCNLEKRHFNEKLVPKLILDDGSEVSELNKIIIEQKKFYENLYTTKNTTITDDQNDMFFDPENPYIETLTDEQATSLEGHLSNTECLNALKKMKNGKSPGLDGFTIEFYKFFWLDLGDYLVKSLNYGYNNGSFSVTQKQGVITCLPKEGKSKFYLKNWRPISLLNIDFKIASSAIANRIKPIISDLISKTQLGFVKGRYIGECSRLIFDLIEKLEADNIPGILVLLDFEKAFDSLEWNFIEKCLNFYGFGPSILNWFHSFYNNASSCVLNNGHLSDFFQIQRGVRQGDPLSPYLFILCVEFLSAALKNEPNIKGIRVNDSEYLLSQYADDTSLMLSDEERSLNTALEMIEMFSHCSGLKANFEKSQAIWIGSRKGYSNKLTTTKDIHWNFTGKFKLLGLKYELFSQIPYLINFKEKGESIYKLLQNWSFRNLSLIGKRTVIKSLALPIIIQTFTVLPDPPKYILNNIQSIFFDFLWSGKGDKIKRNVIINSQENGGLGIPHVASFCQAVKITWIKKLIDITNQSDWKNLLIDDLEPYGGDRVFYFTKEGIKTIGHGLNSFWSNVFNIWANLVDEDQILTNNMILSQPLWYNKHILIGNESVKWKHWMKESLFFVNDLMKADGSGFVPIEQITSNPNLKTNYLECYGLYSAIPREWKDVTKNNQKISHIDNKLIEILQKHEQTTKIFYNMIIEATTEVPTKTQRKWMDHLEVEIDENEWKRINRAPFQIVDDSNLQSFQFKLIHRIIYTNHRLFKCKLVETDLCTFCNETNETLTHLFYDCAPVKTMLLGFRDSFQASGVDFLLDKTRYLFSIYNSTDSRILNLISLLLKKFIYICKMKKQVPDLHSCLRFIKHYRTIELYSLYLYSPEKARRIKNSWDSIRTALS